MYENGSPSGVITDNHELQSLCRATLQEVSDAFTGRAIAAEFYPYIGLTHTIRRRGSAWAIRISEHCRHAPREILRSIVILLACKVLRKKPPAGAVRAYEEFQRLPEVESSVRANRLRRGRKRIADRPGRHHPLQEIFRELNHTHFQDQVEIQRLGWGARRSWGRLGHYDPIHHTITISPVLDSPRVPRCAVSYIVYHEMLHTLFEQKAAGSGRRFHTPEFHRAERAFPHYAEARKFLETFCRMKGKLR